MNPNQNGAVMPYALASRPPIDRADDESADVRDAVDAGHTAEHLVRHRPLPHDLRCRAPDEGVGPEHHQRGQRHDP